MQIGVSGQRMDDTDPSEKTQQLKRMIRAELEARGDVLEYEIIEIGDTGVHVVLEEEDDTRRYHVTLERLPDETVETHWSYMGSDKTN